MSDTAITIRMAEESDAQALLAIYAPYVEKTAVTFEYEVPTVLEFKNRIASTLKRYPYLAAIRDGHILGYAYASAFKERAAYDWAVETSIYVSEGARRTGAGSLLYEALEDYLKRQNVINVNACIAYPNPGSIAFHENTATAPWAILPNAAINWASGGIWSGWKNAGSPSGTAGAIYTGCQALVPGFWLKISCSREVRSLTASPAAHISRPAACTASQCPHSNLPCSSSTASSSPG